MTAITEEPREPKSFPSPADSDSFIGRYVCFGRQDGTFCWGRIERESSINTGDGLKEAFVLTGMMTCSLPMNVPGMVASATPTGAVVSNVANPGAGSPQTKLGLRRYKGERIIRKDVIDLSRDVFDVEGILAGMSDDEMFMFVMSRRLDGAKGVPLGIQNMVAQGCTEFPEEMESEAIKRLKNRVGVTE